MAKKNKSLPRYIFSIKSLYYFRYILTPDIAEVVKKRELRYALQTGYIRKAKIKANRLIASVSEFVQNVRQKSHIIRNIVIENSVAKCDQVKVRELSQLSPICTSS